MTIDNYIAKASMIGLRKGYQALDTSARNMNTHRSSHFRGVVIYTLYNFRELEQARIGRLLSITPKNTRYWLKRINDLISIKDTQTMSVLDELTDIDTEPCFAGLG